MSPTPTIPEIDEPPADGGLDDRPKRSRRNKLVSTLTGAQGFLAIVAAIKPDWFSPEAYALMVAGGSFAIVLINIWLPVGGKE